MLHSQMKPIKAKSLDLKGKCVVIFTDSIKDNFFASYLFT